MTLCFAGSSALSPTITAIIVVVLVVVSIDIMFAVWWKRFHASKPQPDTEHSSNARPVANIPKLEYPEGVNNIDRDDVRVDRFDAVIGQGSYSRVVRARLAIKVFHGANKDYNVLFSEALKEAKVVIVVTRKILKKSVIINVYGVAVGNLPPELSRSFNLTQAVGIVRKYEAGGSLASLIHAPSARHITQWLSLQQKLALLFSIVDGVMELHTTGTVHGDFKPENILLNDTVNPTAVISDFGLAEIKESEYQSYMSTLVQTAATKGTLAYCAPEMLTNPTLPLDLFAKNAVTKASRKTDMYAFGLVTWELFARKRPFVECNNDETMLAMKEHGNVRPSHPWPIYRAMCPQLCVT